MLSALMMRYGARWLPTPLGKEFINDGRASTITDTATGLLSTGVVVSHVNKTLKQINTIYREVVALDLDKEPEDVTWRDFLRCKNDLVRDALGNVVKQNLQRGLAAMVPFAGPVGKLLIGWKGPKDEARRADLMSRFDNTFEAGLGVIGVVQFVEVNRKRTVFEHVRSFVSKELNPGHVLESHLDLNDLHHLYQAYAKKYQPHSYFRHDDRDLPKEASALIVFDRMAELMNASYQSKAIYSGAAQFKLPHFLHLMGHKRIDMTRPEETILYAEVMANHGPKAMAAVDKQLAAGVPVARIAEQFGVTVDMEQLKQSYIERHPPHTTGLGEPRHSHQKPTHRLAPQEQPEQAPAERRFTDRIQPQPENRTPQKTAEGGHAEGVSASRLTQGTAPARMGG